MSPIFTEYISIVLVLASMATAHPIAAQNTAQDSTAATDLNEIVVESRNASLSALGASYIPSARQKNVASDGYSLLLHMAIPQINVNPASDAVTTSTGKNVAIFIDFVSASAEDIQGMLATDVKRVEYLVYPQDPRFHGAEFVINFIMKKYEWGGYTKLTATGCIEEPQVGGRIYSKMKYKRMTFDLSAADSFTSNSRIGTDMTEGFSLNNPQSGSDQDIFRQTNTLSSDKKSNVGNVSFRSLYSSDNLTLSNTVAYVGSRIPTEDSESEVTYPTGVFPYSNPAVKSSADNVGFRYDLLCDLIINKKLSMSIMGEYQFGRNIARNLRLSDGLDITNNATERSHHASLTDFLLWAPDRHNSLAPFIHVDIRHIGIDYAGDSPSKQTYSTQGYGAGVRYMHVRDNWNAGAMCASGLAKTDMTGVRTTESSPQGSIFGSYSPNDRHRIEASLGIGKEIPETYQKSPVLLRQDEIIWYAGNPELKSYFKHLANLAYSWIPNNIWQMSLSGNYYRANNRIATLYIPETHEGYLLRKYENNGSYSMGRISGSVTAKLCGGCLVANVSPEISCYRLIGDYASSLSDFSGSAQLTWYFGEFYLMGWYSSPTKIIGEESSMRIKYPSQYQLQFGWGHGPWRARIVACNVFNSDWKTTQTSLSTPYYRQDIQRFGYGYHRSLDIQLSYTFGYGKKVGDNSEIEQTELGGSAILR